MNDKDVKRYLKTLGSHMKIEQEFTVRQFLLLSEDCDRRRVNGSQNRCWRWDTPGDDEPYFSFPCSIGTCQRLYGHD